MINGVTMKMNIDDCILSALKEDISSEDVTTNAILRKAIKGTAQLIAKQEGVLCGIEVFARVFQLLDDDIQFDTDCKDGMFLENGQVIGVVTGNMKTILSGERTALNYLQRMSGIASYTKTMVDILKDYKTKLLDTRKTTPNMRIFEKYAVKVGGGHNHRYNLSDGILIKDNHIGAAGSITNAVTMAKEYAPFVRKIEVEVENLEMVAEALTAGADIIMLDNMDNEMMRAAIRMIGTKALTECSGNVTEIRLREIGAIGIDYVSSGALTHSAPIMDYSLKNLVPVNEKI